MIVAWILRKELALILYPCVFEAGKVLKIELFPFSNFLQITIKTTPGKLTEWACLKLHQLNHQGLERKNISLKNS